MADVFVNRRYRTSPRTCVSWQQT